MKYLLNIFEKYFASYCNLTVLLRVQDLGGAGGGLLLGEVGVGHVQELGGAVRGVLGGEGGGARVKDVAVGGGVRDVPGGGEAGGGAGCGDVKR